MFEFLGGTSVDDVSAAYIVATQGYSDACADEPSGVSRLSEYWNSDFDLERSLWDRCILIADLDIDYENFDSPAEAYLHPERVFTLLEPTVQTTLEVLKEHGITPLHTVSGRGHHLVWAIDQKSESFFRLAALGEIPPTLIARYENTTSPCGEHLDTQLGRAFAGLGRVLELVAHRVLALAEPRSSLPIELTAIEVGSGSKGREIVSVDLSEYGDPFDRRHIRIPFSAYLKPRRLIRWLGDEGVSRQFPMFQIPLLWITIKEALSVIRDVHAAVELSQRVSCRIPDHSAGTARLIDEYEHSNLAVFHREFYFPRKDAKEDVKEYSYDSAAASLPPCARLVLDHPNHWLLKPGAIQHIVRVLTAIGWHPRKISELICGRFHADVPWSGFWVRHDRAYRASFYVRLFAGLIESGIDRLIDFNCVSHSEKGYCTVPWCTSSLLPYQEALLVRRRNAGLGGGLVDRLLLPVEHL
jgi:hypothetical protein